MIEFIEHHFIKRFLKALLVLAIILSFLVGLISWDKKKGVDTYVYIIGIISEKLLKYPIEMIKRFNM